MSLRPLHHSSPIPKTNRRKLQRKTARRPWGGCVISLDVGAQQLMIACTSPVVHVHISCYASAQQLLCDRRYRLPQQHILSLPTTYPSSSNNKKRVNHKLMTHPPPNQLRWRVVKSGWRVSKNSSPLKTPINTGDSEGKVKSEEYFLIPYLQHFYRHLRWLFQ